MRDVGFVTRHFATTPEHPDWDPAADITEPTGEPDGEVDTRDIALVTRHFGETY